MIDAKSHNKKSVIQVLAKMIVASVSGGGLKSKAQEVPVLEIEENVNENHHGGNF